MICILAVILVACTSIIAPTETPRPTPTSPPTPTLFSPKPLPWISLRYVDRVYLGFRGFWGWQLQSGGLPIPPNPSFTISYSSGDTFIVEVAAADPPSSISVKVRTDDGSLKPPFPPLLIQPFEIEAGLTSQFTLDLPDGTYMVTVTGVWNGTGEVNYAFRIKIG